MILITVASPREARSFLEKYFEKRGLPQGVPLEVAQGKFLVVTGIGKQNVKRCLQKLELDVSCVINVGTAGSLDPSLARGEILRVDKLYSRGEAIEFKPYLNDFLKGLNPAELESHTLPVPWAIKKKARRVVDMEAAVLAECYPDIPLAFVKVVSDYCSPASLVASALFHRAKIQESLLKAFEGVIHSNK